MVFEGAGNNFISNWILDPNKRQYDKIVFQPIGTKTQIEVNPNLYNSWNGFNIERLIKNQDVKYNEEYIKMFLKQIDYLIGDEPKADKAKQYILYWLAQIIQYPEDMPLVALLFYSDFKGIGKNLFQEILKLIIGEQYFTTTANPARS